MKKQIFATIPYSGKQKEYPFQLSKEYLKYQQYTSNLDSKINGAIKSQSKVIKNKQIQLQNQLHFLQQKYYKESQKLRKMEQYFLTNCQNILKDDIQKWEDNQDFFSKIVKQYQNQIDIHRKINARQKQNAVNLKDSLKISLKEVFLLRLNTQQQNQKKKILNVKAKKLKTQNQQPSTQQSLITKRNIQLYSNFLQAQNKNKLKRIKTESSLPKLVQVQNFQLNNQFQLEQKSYMKPIGLIRTPQKQQFHLDLMLKFLKQYRNQKIKDEYSNWYQKLIFNSRNFQKIVSYFQSLKGNKNDHNQFRKLAKDSSTRNSNAKLQKTKRINTQI